MTTRTLAPGPPWERTDRAAGELADLVAGRPAGRPAAGLAGPSGGTPSFAELLRGS